MSLTSRLFLAIRICRELTPGPKPCHRCCVKAKASDEVVAGLKSLRGLLLFTEVLFKPRLTEVPVRKLCWIAKFPMFWRWMSSLVPVVNALLCGVVKCPKLKAPVTIGSRLGIDGPEEEIALAPTALEEALLEIAPAPWCRNWTPMRWKVRSIRWWKRRAPARPPAPGARPHPPTAGRSVGWRYPCCSPAPGRWYPATKDKGCRRAIGIRYAASWSGCSAAVGPADRD